MNNKKKIINTLRNADKASVEKLMAEETKKNEIFAKIQQRANIENPDYTEYTDNVSGVEKFERRISMIRIASIAASAILVAGSVGGGAAYIMNNKKPVNPVPNPVHSSTATTTDSVTDAATDVSTKAKTTNITESTTKADTTSVTERTTETETTNVTVAATTTAEAAISADNNQQFSITKEELIEKAMNYNGSANYFDKFSADYTVIINQRREFHTEPETCVGKVYLDEINLTASATADRYENDKCINKSIIAIKNNYYYNAEELLAETDYTNGGYIFLETPDKHYCLKDQNTDKVFITPWGRSIELYPDTENWIITGERTENGRKIVSISGVEKGNNNYEGVYYELPYTMEVDAETSLVLSYNLYDSNGNKTYSYELTNYKFNDEAVEFRSAADIISEIENGGYLKR